MRPARSISLLTDHVTNSASQDSPRLRRLCICKSSFFDSSGPVHAPATSHSACRNLAALFLPYMGRRYFRLMGSDNYLDRVCNRIRCSSPSTSFCCHPTIISSASRNGLVGQGCHRLSLHHSGEWVSIPGTSWS